jgi:hypothetical protein
MKIMAAFRSSRFGLAAASLLLLIAATSACGVGLELEWSTVANGGSVTGEDIVLEGVAAPADFGEIGGGDFRILKGSHSGMVTVWENLGIGSENGTNTVFWSLLASDWVLETNPVVGSESWTAVPPEQWQINGQQLTYSAAPIHGTCFFRLARPESQPP